MFVRHATAAIVINENADPGFRAAVNGGRCEPCAVVGELALDGQIQPVRGVLAVGLACRRRGVPTLLV